jgi:hypothetical protein
MKYKTVIEVVTDAKDRDEALEIVGEYLSGNIFSGVDMRYSTRRITHAGKIAVTVTALSFLLAVGILSTFTTRSQGKAVFYPAGINAVQPPLKTSDVNKDTSGFRKDWKEKETKEAISHITK